MIQSQTRQLVVAGASSGAAWFVLALAFDKGVQDLNVPVIPTDGLVASTASLLAGVATGVGVALAFRGAWWTHSRWVSRLTPFASLVLGVATFSVLIWLVRILVGGSPSLGAVGHFQQVLGTFAMYGLMSIFTPVLYACAHVNRIAIRRWVSARH